MGMLMILFVDDGKRAGWGIGGSAGWDDDNRQLKRVSRPFCSVQSLTATNAHNHLSASLRRFSGNGGDSFFGHLVLERNAGKLSMVFLILRRQLRRQAVIEEWVNDCEHLVSIFCCMLCKTADFSRSLDISSG